MGMKDVARKGFVIEWNIYLALGQNHSLSFRLVDWHVLFIVIDIIVIVTVIPSIIYVIFINFLQHAVWPMCMVTSICELRVKIWLIRTHYLQNSLIMSSTKTIASFLTCYLLLTSNESKQNMILNNYFLKLCYSKFGVWIEWLCIIADGVGRTISIKLQSN